MYIVLKQWKEQEATSRYRQIGLKWNSTLLNKKKTCITKGVTKNVTKNDKSLESCYRTLQKMRQKVMKD